MTAPREISTNLDDLGNLHKYRFDRASHFLGQSHHVDPSRRLALAPVHVDLDDLLASVGGSICIGFHDEQKALGLVKPIFLDRVRRAVTTLDMCRAPRQRSIA